MEIRLRVANGRQVGQVIEIPGARFLIGRGEDCHLRPQSDTVSRYHCVLTVAGDWVLVRDLGSKNGTFVNGKRVRPEIEVKDGDRLRVGKLEFEVQYVRDVASIKALPTEGPRKEAAQPLDELDFELSEESRESKVTSASETVTIHNTRIDSAHAESDKPDAEPEIYGILEPEKPSTVDATAELPRSPRPSR